LSKGECFLESAMKTIAVFGSARTEEHSELYREAYELGERLARAGYAVLNGGYNGSMAAVSRGAAEAGGQVIGVTCALFDPLAPNRWLHEEVKTPDLLARLSCMMERADGFMAVRGGIGTLSEVTLAWSLLQTGSVRGKPLVVVGEDWEQLVAAFRAYSSLGSSIATLARVARTPADAVSALDAAFAAPVPTPLSPPPLG
jgi:uncharacterized protein (TIGR00730 family)